MELFYGHYASLEKSFIDYVASRRNNPLEPWLIVCASSLISQRLRAQLARNGGVVANMHFVTISSLLSTLDAAAGPAPALFPQDHLRDFLLKDILSEPGLNQYPLSPGFVRAEPKMATQGPIFDIFSMPSTNSAMILNTDHESWVLMSFHDLGWKLFWMIFTSLSVIGMVVLNLEFRI